MGLLVQFQQRAARLAAGGCEAGTGMEEKENVKEMVAEVVEWILSGTATNDAPSAESAVTATHSGRTGLEPGHGPPGRWNGSWIGFDGMARCSWGVARGIA